MIWRCAVGDTQVVGGARARVRHLGPAAAVQQRGLCRRGLRGGLAAPAHHAAQIGAWPESALLVTTMLSASLPYKVMSMLVQSGGSHVSLGIRYSPTILLKPLLDTYIAEVVFPVT